MMAFLGNRCRAWTAGNQLLILAALTMAFFAYRLGEKISYNEGYGWDGVLYGSLAEDFPKRAIRDGLSENQVQRVLPSAVIHYGLCLLGIPRTKPNIVCVFGLLNVGLITLAAWFWGRLADHEKISGGGKRLGLIGLFVNFAILKWGSYYPVLTDSYAFVLGLLLLYYYVTDNRWAVVGLTAVGAFVWPSFVYHGLLLVIFPRNSTSESDQGGAPWRLNTCVAAAAALTVCVCVFQILRGKIVFQSPIIVVNCGALVRQPFGFNGCVAVLCVLFFLGLAFAALLDHRPLFQPRFWLRSTRSVSLVAGITVLLATRWLAAFLAKSPAPWGMRDAMVLIGWISIKKPCLFGFSHVIYFGPIVLLAFLRWRQVCRALHRYGLGLILCVSANLLLSLDSESRHLVHFFPVLVLGVVKGMEQSKWKAPQYGLFFLLALAFSKVWLKIGVAPDPNHAPDFPAQLLFMNLGPWMSWPAYFLQGSYVLLAGCVLFFLTSPRYARVPGSATVDQAAELCAPAGTAGAGVRIAA